MALTGPPSHLEDVASSSPSGMGFDPWWSFLGLALQLGGVLLALGEEKSDPEKLQQP